MANPRVDCSKCFCPGRLPDGRLVQMNRPMTCLGQFPVQGVRTFSYHCESCNGKAHTQPRKDPRTGQVFMAQVRLTGSDAEFRPNSVGAREQVQIPVAFSLGGAGARHHVQAPPIQTPVPSMQLDPRIGAGTMIPPSHPMHPNNIRTRMQPVKLSEFTGG